MFTSLFFLQTITASVFCVVSLGITLFVVSLDGFNWSSWDAKARVKNYWEGRTGIDCVTENSKCVCKDVNNNSTAGRNTFTLKITNITTLQQLVVNNHRHDDSIPVTLDYKNNQSSRRIITADITNHNRHYNNYYRLSTQLATNSTIYPLTPPSQPSTSFPQSTIKSQ